MGDIYIFGKGFESSTKLHQKVWKIFIVVVVVAHRSWEYWRCRFTFKNSYLGKELTYRHDLFFVVKGKDEAFKEK